MALIYLQQDNAADVLGMVVQQSLERLDAVHQPFGVVQAVHAQQDLLVGVALHHHRGFFGQLCESEGWDGCFVISYFYLLLGNNLLCYIHIHLVPDDSDSA